MSMQCGGTVDKDSLIVINGSEEDLADLTQRMIQRREKAKQEKKLRKEKCITEDSGSSKVEESKMKHKKHRPDEITSNVPNKKSKTLSDNSDSALSNTSKFEKTSSYKKLFHKNGVKKDKAHWVTYNPYYN